MTRGSGFEGGKGRFTFFQEPHTDKEKVDFLKHEYGIGGHSHALSGAMKSDESHDGKGLHYKKGGCPDVHFTWEKVAKRITDLIHKGRYLTEQDRGGAGADRAENVPSWDEEPGSLSAEDGPRRLCGAAGPAGAEGTGIPAAPEQQQPEPAHSPSA